MTTLHMDDKGLVWRDDKKTCLGMLCPTSEQGAWHLQPNVQVGWGWDLETLENLVALIRELEGATK